MLIYLSILCLVKDNSECQQIPPAQGRRPSEVREPREHYCRNAPFRCSLTRADEKFIEYFDSRCYCDLFCYTDSFDCCPDYIEVCLAETELAWMMPQGRIQDSWTNDHRERQDKTEENTKIEKYEGNDTSKKMVDEDSNDKGAFEQRPDGNEMKTSFNDEAYLKHIISGSKDYLNYDGNGSVVSQQGDYSFTINNKTLVDEINSKDKSWKARLYDRWHGDGFALLDSTFGHSECSLLKGIDRISFYEHDYPISGYEPRTKWDPRESSRWPIGPVRDQRGGPPSSWVISAVDVAADRFARMTYISNMWNRTSHPFSVMHILSCMQKEGKWSRCNGAITRVWKFMRNLGTVTEQCYPMQVNGDGECKLLMRRKTRKALRVGAQFARMRCPTMKGKAQQSLFFRIGDPYRLAPTGSTRDIQYEIFLRGPVQATMLACPDFLLYSSGIYKSRTRPNSGNGHLCRYHSVRIVGWGHVYDREKKSRLYWICANSWGQDWGERGYFRIFSNESEISKWTVTTFGHGEHFLHGM